ncbi:electron transfer flavoprotein alpha-subunit [Peziza echinospora]|nr:electron transfer flavoprotein alpha-subunit [Peziza echinospora]
MSAAVCKQYLPRLASRAILSPKVGRTFATSRQLRNTLAILEHRDGKLQNRSLNVVTAAGKFGKPVIAFLAGSGAKEVAEKEVVSLAGVGKVLVIENSAYDKGLPENYAPLVQSTITAEGVTHVVTSHSAFGKNIAPRLAALLDVQPISDVTEIQSEDTFVRPIYAGNAIATVKSSDPIKVLTIRGTSFAPAAATSSTAAPISTATDPEAPSPTTWVSENLTKSERPDLSSAGKVVSGGRGLKDKENFDKIMTPLADALGAAIGASRAAVDSGYADNSLQVGQTGKVVAPELYLAVGISGAIQHLAGMKDSKVIAAINKDGDAPIFQIADVGLVGDLFTIVPELTQKLK